MSAPQLCMLSHRAFFGSVETMASAAALLEGLFALNRIWSAGGHNAHHEHRRDRYDKRLHAAKEVSTTANQCLPLMW
jgi:hypothetical protein